MKLDSKIDIDIKHFFLWWGRELSFLVPEKLKHWLSDQSGRVYFQVNAERLEISLIEDGGKRVIGELPMNQDPANRYSALKSEHAELDKAQCILRLNARQAIGRLLYLPAAAKESLDQVILYEMDRFLPFKAEQVYFAVKLLARENTGQLKILLVVTPKATLDLLIQELNAIGIHPDMVDFDGAANDLEHDLETYNLLPQEFRPVSSRVTRWLTWSAGTAVILLLMAVLVYPVWYAGQRAEFLRRQINKVEKDAQIVQSKQQIIDGVMDETNRLISVKKKSPSLNEIINNLSALMRDDTYLAHLQFNNGRLQLRGKSPGASALIGVLESSPMFKNARFVSPLTQDKRTGLENFQISVDVTVPGAGNAE